MIDWYTVSFSALWIFGLSLEVAGLSIADYLAGQKIQQFRHALETPFCRIMIDLGLVFFCVGWAGSALDTWERIVWAILALIFTMRVWNGRKMRNTSK